MREDKKTILINKSINITITNKQLKNYNFNCQIITKLINNNKIQNIFIHKNETCKLCKNRKLCLSYLNYLKNEYFKLQSKPITSTSTHKPNKTYNHQQTLKLNNNIIIKTHKTKLSTKYKNINNIPTLKFNI